MTSSAIICPDASLVVRLLLAETMQAEIVQLWQGWLEDGKRLAAPKLLHYEVTNALYKYVYHGRMTLDESLAAMQSVLQLGIVISDETAIHQAALALAQERQLPATYDAHYVALAKQLEADFWTADKRLVRALPADWNWVHLWTGR